MPMETQPVLKQKPELVVEITQLVLEVLWPSIITLTQNTNTTLPTTMDRSSATKYKNKQ